MSFLTAEKKDHVARCPARGGGKTYMGNARLKTFFSFGRLPLVHYYSKLMIYMCMFFVIIIIKLRKKMTKLPELEGGGGLANSGNARKKTCIVL